MGDRRVSAAVYYSGAQPVCYSPYRAGQHTPAPIRGLVPVIVPFEQAYRLFAAIRANFTPDGMARP